MSKCSTKSCPPVDISKKFNSFMSNFNAQKRQSTGYLYVEKALFYEGKTYLNKYKI